MGDTEADDVRWLIGHLEGRIDREVDDPQVRAHLYRALDDAMAWSWESVGKAREKLVPVHNHLDG